MTKNTKYLFIGIFFTLILISLLLYHERIFPYLKQRESLKVGVLFSSTGTMAKSEQAVINATLLAIEEINKNGGIDNKQIIPIVYDGESNWKKYAQLAEKMIVQDKVSAIIGCWTSASRKEVKPIIEKYDNLLIYPTQYEGAEESKNIIYLGATPNQQILPAISWAFEHVGKRVFLVGSDYIFPHVANEIIHYEVQSRGGEIVGEKYILLGSKDVDSVIQEIIEKKPDVIFNTINGDTNIAFFERLYELSKGVQRPPVFSFSLSTADMDKIGGKKIKGDYAVWSYLTSQDNPENMTFLKKYKEKYGSTHDINDPAATAYAGVHLWKQAVKETSRALPSFVRDRMLRQSVASPAGVIYIDPVNANAWRIVLISQFTEKGQMDMIWTSVNPIEPIVYPDFKKKAEWDFFEYKLYMKWNNSWGNT